MAIDHDGNQNVYVGGFFNATVDFDPGIGTNSYTAQGFDGFITKYDDDGNYVWAHTFSSSSGDQVQDIVVENGYVYVLGDFQNSMDVDFGSGTQILNTNGSQDIFICKYDTNANLVWAKNIGGASNEHGTGLTIDNRGNVIVCGYFQGTCDFDPSSSTFNLSVVGNNDAFTCKLDSNGTFVWVKSFGGSFDQYSFDVDCDTLGSVFTVGYFLGTADFDPSSGTSNRTASAQDGFIVKLDSNGNFNWVGQFSTNSFCAPTEISVANSRIAVAGRHSGTTDLNPFSGTSNYTAASSDGFISVLSYSTQTFLWGYTIGGSGTDQLYGLDNNSEDDFAVTGFYAGTMDFNPSSGTQFETASGSNDVFVIQFDSNGVYEYGSSLGGADTDQGRKVSLSNNRVAATGFYRVNGDYDMSAEQLILTSNGNQDVFISNAYICDTTVVDLVTVSCDSFIAPSGKTIYSSSIVFDTVLNSLGCDSVMEIDVTINQSYLDTIDTFVCDSFSFPSGQVVYGGGIYFDTLTASNGCDSVFYIDLELNTTLGGTIVLSVCDSFILPSGTDTIYTSGFYEDTIPASNGCDSALLYNLTVLNSSSSYQMVEACEQYVSPSGLVLNETGNYFDTIQNAAGCDSVIEIDLLMDTLEFTVDSVVACDSFVWQANQITYTESGTYTEILSSSGSCDSTVTLELTVLHSSIDTVEQTACQYYVRPTGDTVLQSGIYIDTLVSSSNCDSIIYQDVQITTIDTGITISGGSFSSALISNQDSALYQWLRCDLINNTYEVMTGETGQVLFSNNSGSGNYAVEVTLNGCTDTTDCYYAIHVIGVDDLDLSEFKAFPNPTNGLITINLPSEVRGECELRVMSSDGRIVKATVISTQENMIDLSQLSNGLYRLILTSDQVYGNTTIVLTR